METKPAAKNEVHKLIETLKNQAQAHGKRKDLCVGLYLQVVLQDLFVRGQIEKGAVEKWNQHFTNFPI